MSVCISGLLLLAVTLIGAGCGGATTNPGDTFARVIGSEGTTAGTFHRPRGIAFDPGHDLFYVVDWSGRIQKFTRDGQFRGSWIMPDVKNGKPEDLCLGTNGHLYVADTHYSRILEYTADGQLARSFGRFGKATGQFVYPVGICSDGRGTLYVSEYGGEDRIQKFREDGTFLTAWGAFGTEPGQFQRPSGIAMSGAGELYVADAVNHRIQVFDADGRLRRVLGKEGTGPGEFRYPYDVTVDGDAIVVLEYGNQRAQRLTPDGKPLGLFGRPGRGEGCLANPWRCEAILGQLYISDTDNNRVVVCDGWRTPDGG